jgi:site-specific recombinase XerC
MWQLSGDAKYPLGCYPIFFRFLQHREPGAVEQVRRVLAIPFKKTDTRLVPYLVQEEIQALLDAPDPSTREGVRDRAMLHLAVCAGLRVSELTGLRLDDVAPRSASIRVHGKGRRERALPLWKTTAAALRAWLAVRGSVASPELFVTPKVSLSVDGESHTFCAVTRKRRTENAQPCMENKSVPMSFATIYSSGLCRVVKSVCGFGSEIPDRALQSPEHYAT